MVLWDKNGNVRWWLVIVGIIAIVLLVGTVLAGIRGVPSNHVGIKTAFGRIVGEVGEGLNLVNPWIGEDIIPMDGTTHSLTLSNLSCGTASQQEVTVKATVTYRINTAFATEIYRTLRTEWEDRVIRTNLENSLKSSTAKFAAEELLQNREAVVSMFRNLISEKLAPYYIIVESVQLEDFQFSAQYYKQIEDTNTAQMKALEEKNNLEIVKYQQEQEVIKKEAEATMMRIEAEAYANATLTRAYADAEAIQAIAEKLSTSPDYLEYYSIEQYYEVWDGTVPVIVGSSGQQYILPAEFLEQVLNSTTPSP